MGMRNTIFYDHLEIVPHGFFLNKSFFNLATVDMDPFKSSLIPPCSYFGVNFGLLLLLFADRAVVGLERR